MEIIRIDPFLHHFDGPCDRTMRVHDHVAPERLEWRSGPGQFSVGDQMRLLAALERHMYAENALGRPSLYAGRGEEVASGYDEVRAYAGRLHGLTLDLLSTLSEEDLQKKTETPAGRRWVRPGWSSRE